MRYNENYSAPRGGGMRIGPGGISPFIKLMLIANGAVFFLQYFIPQLTYTLGLVPERFFGEFPNYLFQPFTYMFLHGGIWHLLFNMLALWMFGTEIEYAWGSRTFAKFYLLSGLSGAVATLIFQASSPIAVVGASAAIYGVLIAYWLMFPERLLYIYFIIPIKVKWAIPGMMVLVFLTGGAKVAHLAHLGGALFGLIYIKMDWRRGRLGSWWREIGYKRKEAKFEKKRMKAEETMKRVDEILDKINEVGIDNISAEDRKFLEEASTNLSGEKKID